MKRIMLSAAVVLAACSEGTIAGPDAQFARGAEPTAVATAQVIISVGGSVTFRQSGPANTGVGSCTTGGQWSNAPAAGAGHPNCASVTGGSQTTSSIKVSKNTSGSQLNGGTAYVWYRKAINLTQGDGLFNGTDGWTVLGTQPLLNNKGNFVNRAGMVVMACNGSACHPGVVSW